MRQNQATTESCQAKGVVLICYRDGRKVFRVHMTETARVIGESTEALDVAPFALPVPTPLN